MARGSSHGNDLDQRIGNEEPEPGGFYILDTYNAELVCEYILPRLKFLFPF